MSLSTGDKVYIDCIGEWCGCEGIVIGHRSDGSCVVKIGFGGPEPICEVFAEEHLIPTMGNFKEGKVGEIKDSGERTKFGSGAVRDMHEGKGDMLSVPWAAMLRVSTHYENGAKKYGRYNYLKGIPVSSFIDSAIRHLAKYVAGYDDEDHLSAAAFNVLGAIQMEEEMPEMCDLPWRKGKREFHYGEKRDSEKVSPDVPGEGTQEAGPVRDNDRGQD